MFVAGGIWCLADVSSVSPSSEQTDRLTPLLHLLEYEAGSNGFLYGLIQYSQLNSINLMNVSSYTIKQVYI